MRRFLLLLLMWSAGLMSLIAKDDIKYPETYNFQRGLEALNNNNDSEALNYLKKEVDDNPQNGYAYWLIANIYANNANYGSALTAIDMSLKFIPKKDKETRCRAFMTRATIYTGLEKTDEALSNYSWAIKENPQNTDAYDGRGQLYFEQEKYDLSNKDYEKIIDIDPGNAKAYVGLARNANIEKQYDEAIKQLNYVIKLSPNYSEGYAFRAQSYIALKKYIAVR